MQSARVAAASILLLLGLLIFTPTLTQAKPNEYDLVVKHLKTKYQAKKVRIPFLWLARFAVKVVRPAGVKSFNITLFEDLKFSGETMDEDMRSALRNSFGPDWSAILRVRSKEGQQAYMYMRESGKNVKITLLTMQQTRAVLVRATFSPERLAEFINDPKIFGISLAGKPPQKQTEQLTQAAEGTL
jgi:hypothetical protein